MSATREKPFLVGKGLSKRYPGVLALDDVDGAIQRGVILGFVGKNGAGKSTLLKIFAGAVRPDSGQVLIDGEEVDLHSPHDATKRGLAFVHQELADVPNLSVAENIELGLGYPRRAGLVNKRELRRKTREVLKRLDADIDPRAPVASLSLAQRRLSTQVRDVRRRVASVSGTIVRPDGSEEPVTTETLIGAEERALQILTVATVVLALALVMMRVA